MSQWKRLLFYLALNIVVSACATFVVLWVWDRAHPGISLFGTLSLFSPAGPAANPAPTNPPAPPPTKVAAAPTKAATPPGGLPKLISIDNVFGVGNLKEEFVLLKRVGDGELPLTNWTLDDGSGNTYKFPALTLYKDGAVQVHTGAGVDSVVDLYWGRNKSVWQTGKTVKLYDDQKNLRASYQIP